MEMRSQLDVNYKTATIGITIIAIKFKMSLHSIFSPSKLHPFAISARPFFSKLFAFYRHCERFC